jgi:hypothetical protein
MLRAMAFDSDAPIDLLWKEYGLAFRDFDDLTLARWLVWLKRLATPPAAYAESPCCHAPMLPLLTRDVR